MCTGDFNGSYSPELKNGSASVIMTNLERQIAAAGQQIELPVRLINASEVGAISLILDYPQELMEVTDVTMKENDGDLAWFAKGGELRIGWNSLHPLTYLDGESLLTIHIATSASFGPGDVILIELAGNHLVELADASYHVIPGALIDIDAIEFSANGIFEPDQESSLRLMSFPNPFSGFTYISYTLPADGHVTLQINDMLGRPVVIPVDKYENIGSYMIRLDALPLQPGIYTATLTLQNNNRDLARTIKLVRNW
jgi:hypothetical protein